MLTRLALPYSDTSAAALRWSAAPHGVPALDVLVLADGATRLELHLLGSSHSAVLHAPGAGPLVETVACTDDDAGEPLPARRELRRGALRYRFTSGVALHDRTGLQALAARLRDEVAGRDDSVAGVFPGAADALTVLRGRAGRRSAAWRTWHLYPNTGEVVRTTAEVAW